MTLNEENVKALIAKSESCFIEAECFYNQAFLRPEYAFNQRGKIAGSAHLQKNIIKFNPILYLQNQSLFIEHVVAHEVAHLIAFQLYGRVKPHGKEWQGIMKHVFNVPANTTHQFDIKDVQGKVFNYICACTTHVLSIRRHNKVRKGSRYVCRQCKTELVASHE